ncbi:MAG: site-specific integrase [Pseudonocardiales bacterium]|nr:MAG: site-specific integrase [Pseudonocardiales bacterium]
MAWSRKRVDSDGQRRHTGYYRDPAGKTRSAGTFTSERAALRAAQRHEVKVEDGTWYDRQAGRVTFRRYVEEQWWPSRHLEASTKAGYRSYLDRHFLPFFGDIPIADILPSAVQAWVTKAAADGLSARSIVKYHVMLHSVFKRAVRDRVIGYNPCADTELPKVIAPKTRILTPEEFQALLAHIPQRFVPLVLTEIETGLRWGELIALRPRHVDFLRRTITVEETIVEVSRKVSPTGKRFLVKHYPKDNESRVVGVRPQLISVLSRQIERLGLGRDDLLFPSAETAGGNPLSRNTFRSRYWLPALEAAGLGFHVRMHDLRHAHASWLLAGGADLKTVMDRLGHSQIQTTQKYLHTLPDSQELALEALTRVERRGAG